MGIDLQALGWMNAAERGDVADSRNADALRKRVERLKGGSRVAESAIAEKAHSLDAEVSRLREKGERNAAKAVRKILEPHMSDVAVETPEVDPSFDETLKSAPLVGSDRWKQELYG
jgi:hypothetical protein